MHRTKENAPPEFRQGNRTAQNKIILGKKLNNPYSVENMQNAYNTVTQKNDSNLEATHYYLRFLPASDEEMEVLKSDTTLYLFDFPLDYELEEGGTYYHDPDIPEGEITWQYTAVTVNYNFPDITYEIIEDLYLPETDETKSSNAKFWYKVEQVALEQTGNLPKGESANQKAIGRWFPSGHIQVWDREIGISITTHTVQHWVYVYCATGDTVEDANLRSPDLLGEDICVIPAYETITDTVTGSFVPVARCKVMARNWFTFKTAITDTEGDFRFHRSFNGPVDYSIIWESEEFNIRENNLGQAWHIGPREHRGSWLASFMDGSAPASWRHAHIYRAAITYYYNSDNWGIEPPMGGSDMLLQRRLHIGAMNRHGTSKYLDFIPFANDIYIYCRRDNGSMRPSINIFGTTIHELAHASHWKIGYTYGQYAIESIFSAPYLPESWATGVEKVITSDVYQTTDYEYRQDYDLNHTAILDGYTPIVWDMIDDFNQRDEFSDTNLPIDRVEGFTLAELEDCLYGNFTWEAWRDAISARPNPTSIYVDELFDNYNAK